MTSLSLRAGELSRALSSATVDRLVIKLMTEGSR